MDTAALKQRLAKLHFETPSWGFANSGTRFGTFLQDSSARTFEEKIADAGQVQAFTGICPTVALHIPWDIPSDGNWNGVKALAAEHGIGIGAINPNVFQDQCYKWGALCHNQAEVRQRAIEHHHECIAIASACGSRDISLWYADGSNYPGQVHFRERRARLLEGLQAVYARLAPSQRLLIEYKFFEPAFYHTDLSDWGQVMLLAQKLGPQAKVLVDTGHHATGTNIEHIVATLLDEGRLGGFHFNNRKYADDDLTVGSINPYEIFLIFNELVAAESEGGAVAQCAAEVAYMFDQSHNLKNKIEATIQSAVFCQEMWAKCLLVDRPALAAARAGNDVIMAEEVLRDAYHADVRPLLREIRADQGLDPEPLKAFRASGYTERVAAERTAKHGKGKAGGYQ
jgi:L-rhamnose isomerase/sugar isomerase